MLRFLRKHSKWILAIFGTGLMIAFLIPFAIQNFSQAAATSTATWAHIGPDGEDVSARALDESQRDLLILERLGLGVPYFGALKSPEHWYLLVREAQDAGVLGGRGLDLLGLEQAQLMVSAGVASPAELNRVFARLDGVRRLMSMYTGAGKLSDRRMRAAAQRLFHIIGGRFVMLQAEPGPDDPVPSEDALLAQFEEFRDVAEGEGEHGFGYRIPDRLKYEYLRVTRSAIEGYIDAAELINPVTIRKHWMEAPPTAGLPTYTSGVPVPLEVFSDFRRNIFDETRTRVVRAADALIRERQRHLPSPTGYFELPDDWAERRVQLPELAQALEKEFPGLALPEYTAVNEWLTVADFRRHDLTMDWLDIPGARRPNPSRAAIALHEFGGPADPAFQIQSGIMAPHIKSVDDGIVFWRVTDADPAHAATSLDEVRDAVVRDLQRLDAYERLLAECGSIEQQVRDIGILEVGVEREARVFHRTRISPYEPTLLDFQLRSNQVPTQTPSAMPTPVGSDADVVQGIVDETIARTPAGGADEPLIFTYAVEKHLLVFVMEVDKQIPLDRERYEQIAGNQALQQIMLVEELEAMTDLADVFGYEALAARHEFKLERRANAADADEAETTETAEGT